jgi:type II secretory pathway component PulM
VSAWYGGLSERERRIVRLGTLVVVATLVWLLVVEPLQAALDAATARRDGMAASAERMQAIAQRVERLGGVGLSADGDPVALVEAMLRDQLPSIPGLRVSRPAADRLSIEAEFDSHVQMVSAVRGLEAAGFIILRAQLSVPASDETGSGLSARLELLSP